MVADVHISAKVDYALRALATLAAAEPDPRTADELAEAQRLPVRFLRSILDDLRRGHIVSSQRGSEGGYRLARPAAEVTIGEVVRRLDGPLAEVRGERPEDAVYEGAAEHLQTVWVAVRACLRRRPRRGNPGRRRERRPAEAGAEPRRPAGRLAAALAGTGSRPVGRGEDSGEVVAAEDVGDGGVLEHRVDGVGDQRRDRETSILSMRRSVGMRHRVGDDDP